MDFKKFLPWIIAAVVVFGIYGWVKGINNTAVTYEQDINESWGNVQTAYQRRNDLIGNLVNTVKGAADFEKSTLEAVTEILVSNFAWTASPRFPVYFSGATNHTRACNVCEVASKFLNIT